MFRLITRYFSIKKNPIYFSNINEKPKEVPEGYEEEFKPNPDFGNKKEQEKKIYFSIYYNENSERNDSMWI